MPVALRYDAAARAEDATCDRCGWRAAQTDIKDIARYNTYAIALTISITSSPIHTLRLPMFDAARCVYTVKIRNTDS